MKTIQTIIVTLLFMALPLSVKATPLKIFVSIPPQKWLSQKIGDSLVETHVLVAKGQDPHSYEPTPRQLIELSRAELFFSIGMSFEERLLNKISHTAAAIKFVDLSRHVHKIPMTGQQDKDHSRDEGHDADHGHSGLDPHIWLSPLNLKIMARTMAEAMILADPTNKAGYEANLNRTVSDLDRLHEKIQGQLAPFHGGTFYVFHPAFGYFAREYNLHQKAVEVEGKSPTPKQLSHLIQSARKEKILTIFVQPQFDEKSASAVAKAIGGKVVPLSPLAEDVTGNLEIMANAIEAALK